LDSLRNRRPEWSPWLEVVDEIVRETASGRWKAMVPEQPVTGPPRPLLTGATLMVDGTAVRRLLERLIETAARNGTPKMATLRSVLRQDVDAARLFAASIQQKNDGITDLAARTGADGDALQAVVALVAVPFLHACHRGWASLVPSTWTEGYCPVCASWPSFAELRGIERSRYLRCARCGGEWHAQILHCAYCGMNDHDELVSLVPEKPGSSGAIEACKRCRGYVKAFTRLQGCPPATVMLEDLASVNLDLAALAQGYARPAGAGCGIDVTVAAGAGHRFFAWNA
jgi:FdhE protein